AQLCLLKSATSACASSNPPCRKPLPPVEVYFKPRPEFRRHRCYAQVRCDRLSVPDAAVLRARPVTSPGWRSECKFLRPRARRCTDTAATRCSERVSMSKLAIAMATTVALTRSASAWSATPAHAVGLGSPAEGAVQRAQGQASGPLPGIKG